MARKTRKTQDAPSDDDAPEVVSHSTSKADAKRSQKALHNFEAEERARRKACNRARDQKLKERARVIRGRRMDEKLKVIRFMDQKLDGEDDGDSGEEDGDDDVEVRMLRAMRDAADEVESGKEEGDDDEFNGFEQDDMASDKEDSTDNEEMDEGDEDEEAIPLPQGNVHKSSTKPDYLADDLFIAAFASQNSIPAPKKTTESTEQQMVRKRRRKSIPHPKDLVIGGRIIRTLPQPSDPRSQATARSVPSARARRFVDQSLAMKGKQAFLKAKRKGWERRPVNVGVMKYQGAPHGFTRAT